MRLKHKDHRGDLYLFVCHSVSDLLKLKLNYILAFILFATTLFGQSIQYEFSQKENGVINGLGKITSKPLNDTLIKVNYAYEKTAEINPYKISYSYMIYPLTEHSFELDMISVLDDVDAFFHENVNLNYNGDKLDYNLNEAVNTKLKNKKGELNITMKDTPLDLSYIIEITNREVLNTKEVNIDGRKFMALEVSYNYGLTKMYEGNEIGSTQQKVIDLILPNLGVIDRVRKGVTTNLIANKKEIINNEMKLKS